MDGKGLYTSRELHAVDVGFPLPMPPQMPGQVWADVHGNAWMILSVTRHGTVIAETEADGGVVVPTLRLRSEAEYRHLVLVCGPGAPWAPPGWTSSFSPPGVNP